MLCIISGYRWYGVTRGAGGRGQQRGEQDRGLDKLTMMMTVIMMIMMIDDDE
jgi:hypothetical protein